MSEEIKVNIIADNLADKLEWALKLLKTPSLYMGKPEVFEKFEKALQIHAEWANNRPNKEPQSPEWMPIESAPKDFSWILGWRKNWTTPRPCRFFKYIGDFLPSKQPGLPYWKTSALRPTHWMPLPKAPEAK